MTKNYDQKIQYTNVLTLVSTEEDGNKIIAEFLKQHFKTDDELNLKLEFNSLSYYVKPSPYVSKNEEGEWFIDVYIKLPKLTELNEVELNDFNNLFDPDSVKLSAAIKELPVTNSEQEN